MAYGGDVRGAVGVLELKSHWGRLQAATALGLAAKTLAYSFRTSINTFFSDGESCPMLASSRLFCWADSRESACLSGTFSVILSSPA